MAETETEAKPKPRTRRGARTAKSEQSEPAAGTDRERGDDDSEREQGGEQLQEADEQPREAEQPEETPGANLDAVAAARLAMEQVGSLTNREAEGVVGIESADDGGWEVTVEVVESRRIPNTADVLAEYAVVLDGAGRVSSYSRRSRYLRGRARVDS